MKSTQFMTQDALYTKYTPFYQREECMHMYIRLNGYVTSLTKHITNLEHRLLIKAFFFLEVL
jgi:hypothetical protein